MKLSFLANETNHLYLDESTLKLAKVLRGKNGKIVTGVYHKDIQGQTAEDVVNILWEAKKALGMHGRKVHAIIPSSRVITKSIEVPSLDLAEIGDIIRLQAGRHTPYAREEIIVGHINLEVVLDRFMKSLLAIVANDVVRMMTTTLDLAGFQVESIHLGSEILCHAAIETQNLDDEKKPAGFLHVDSGFTDFMIIFKHKPFFIRNIPIGSKQLNESMDSHLKRLLTEIKKSIDAYQSDESGDLPDKYFVSGSSIKNQDRFLKAAQAELGLVIEAFDPYESVPATDEVKEVLSEAGDVSLLDVMSSGVNVLEPDIDLLPEDLRIKKAFRKRGQEIFVGGVSLLVIFILMMGTYLTKIYYNNVYLSDLQTQFKRKSRDVERLIYLSDQTRHIRDFEHKKGQALKVLTEVAALLPPEMYLKEISLNDQEGKVVMEGTSELMSTVFSYVTDFENNPNFQSVVTDYTKSRKEGKEDVADFGISATLETNLEGS